MSEPVRVDLTDLVSGIGQYLGYEPQENHLVVLGLSSTNRLGPLACVPWEPEYDPDPVFAPSLAYALRGARDTNAVIVVGYGDDGPDRALRVADALSETLVIRDVAAVDLRAGTVRAHLGTSWSEPQPLNSRLEAELVLQGQPLVRGSREDLLASVAPLPEPTYAPLSQDALDKIELRSPRDRATDVLRQLDVLARPDSTASSTLVATTRALLAHSMATSPMLRDVVLAETVQDPRAHQALLDLYRGAPAVYLGELAPAAAASEYLCSARTMTAAAILEHTNRSGPNTNLANLLGTCIQLGLDPDSVRGSFSRDGAHEAVAQAETTFRAAARATLRSNSFPAPPATKGPTTHDRAPGASPLDPSPKQHRPDQPGKDTDHGRD